jgi:carbon-monoxide dehydrogenase small subunit
VKIVQSFAVARPAAVVWAFFQDIPAVASCLPGAELVEGGADGIHKGKVGVKLGPFKATFEGEAKITADAATRSGHVEGRGVDKRGGSHSRMLLDYKLNDVDQATRVDIDVDLTLSGPIAQFGRTGLVTEVANVLVGDFARTLEARISTPTATAGDRPPPQPTQLNALSLLIAATRTWFRKLLGRV